jgi:hypothetical protein
MRQDPDIAASPRPPAAGGQGPLAALSRPFARHMQQAAAETFARMAEERDARLLEEIGRQQARMGEELAATLAQEMHRNLAHVHAHLVEHVTQELSRQAGVMAQEMARQAGLLEARLSQALGQQAEQINAQLGQELGRQAAHLDSHFSQQLHQQMTHLDGHISEGLHQQIAHLDSHLSQELQRQQAHLGQHLAAAEALRPALAEAETRQVQTWMAEALAQHQATLLQDLHRHMSHVDAHLSEHLSRQLALQLGAGTGRSFHRPPAVLQQRLLELGRLLRPMAAEGVAKRRIGHEADGGYVLLDDFAGIGFALSFGVGQEITWDLDIAERGIAVHQFDHTIEQPPGTHPRLHFHRRRIAPAPAEDAESLRSAQALGGGGRCIVKMDIEGDEWRVLEAAGPGDFTEISQLIVEFHDFDRVDDDAWHARAARVLAALGEHFAVVHVHANNHGALQVAGNLAFPEILEVTFANRAFYAFADSNEVFPTALDAPNRTDMPDIALGSFRF